MDVNDPQQKALSFVLDLVELLGVLNFDALKDLFGLTHFLALFTLKSNL